MKKFSHKQTHAYIHKWGSTHTNTHARALEQVASQERVLAKHHGSQIPIVSPKCARDIDFSGPRSEPGNEQPHHIFIPTPPQENEGKGGDPPLAAGVII